MLEIRMRPKHQVTLPASIVREANLQPDDKLSVDYINGSIIITPARLTGSAGADLLAYAGIAQGAWGRSPQEVEKTIAETRDSWSR